MKWIVLILFLFTHLVAYEQPVEEQKALEALFIKMGITSLTKDFEIEKENILQNTNDIEELKKQVQYLLQENMKLKLEVKDTTMSDENKLLKQKLEKLQETIEAKDTLINNTKNQSNTTNDYKTAIITSENGLIVQTPYPSSEQIGMFDQNTMIKIESCDKYGWCKLFENDGYIAIYRIRFIQ